MTAATACPGADTLLLVGALFGMGLTVALLAAVDAWNAAVARRAAAARTAASR